MPALGNALPFLPSGAAGERFASCAKIFSFAKYILTIFYRYVIINLQAHFVWKSEVRFMKETYVAPELEVVEFDCEDVITTSGVNPDENELPIVPIG